MKIKTTTDTLVPFFEVVRLRWVLGFGLLDYGTLLPQKYPPNIISKQEQVLSFDTFGQVSFVWSLGSYLLKG